MSNVQDFSIELAQKFFESEEGFPVDLDDAWIWIGYSAKQNAFTALEGCFAEGEDFLCSGIRKTESGRNASIVMLTIDCFKSMGMMAKTEKGKEIRKYFLRCEKEMKRLAAEKAVSQFTSTSHVDVTVSANDDRASLKESLSTLHEMMSAIRLERERMVKAYGSSNPRLLADILDRLDADMELLIQVETPSTAEPIPTVPENPSTSPESVKEESPESQEPFISAERVFVKNNGLDVVFDIAPLKAFLSKHKYVRSDALNRLFVPTDWATSNLGGCSAMTNLMSRIGWSKCYPVTSAGLKGVDLWMRTPDAIALKKVKGAAPWDDEIAEFADGKDLVDVRIIVMDWNATKSDLSIILTHRLASKSLRQLGWIQKTSVHNTSGYYTYLRP